MSWVKTCKKEKHWRKIRWRKSAFALEEDELEEEQTEGAVRGK